MFFVSMEEFLSQITGGEGMDDGLQTQPAPYGQQFDEMFGGLPEGYEPVPIDMDGDTIADGWGYDLDGDGKFEMIQYDFNHDGTVDAMMMDTNGDGIPDTIYYDFDGDGLADATLCDTTGDGLMDTLTLNNGVHIVSDAGFTVNSGWEAGMQRLGTEAPVQAGPLGLNEAEQRFAQNAVAGEPATPKIGQVTPSFGATCIPNTIGCAGCAGLLLDKKIRCGSGTIL